MAVVSVTLLAGCGASSPGSNATADSSHHVSSAATVGRVTSSRATKSAASASGPLAYAECMRANGVPNFPDPSAGGGFQIPASDNPASPAFKAAEAKCQKLESGAVGGAPTPGGTTHPTAQTLAKMRKIAQCMREHGIAQFPDPTTSVPSSMVGVRQIADRDGAIFVFKDTLDMLSPAFTKAAAACGLALTHHS